MHRMMSACAHTTLQQGVLMPPLHARADARNWQEPAMDGSALLGLRELKVTPTVLTGSRHCSNEGQSSSGVAKIDLKPNTRLTGVFSERLELAPAVPMQNS